MGHTDGWPDESREAAQPVIDKYGDPDEVTASVLIWNHPGPWKSAVAVWNMTTGEGVNRSDAVSEWLRR